MSTRRLRNRSTSSPVSGATKEQAPSSRKMSPASALEPVSVLTQIEHDEHRVIAEHVHRLADEQHSHVAVGEHPLPHLDLLVRLSRVQQARLSRSRSRRLLAAAGNRRFARWPSAVPAASISSGRADDAAVDEQVGHPVLVAEPDRVNHAQFEQVTTAMPRASQSPGHRGYASTAREQHDLRVRR